VRIRRITSHSLQALAEASLIAMLVVGLMAGSAFAAKGGGKPSAGTGTVSLSVMDGATEAHFGARVTFDVATTATAYPYVHLMCYANGSLVGEGRQGFFSNALGNEWFILGPTDNWSAGAADCTAKLEKATNKGGWSVLGSTTFHVYE
jgi:hypothetical protein